MRKLLNLACVVLFCVCLHIVCGQNTPLTHCSLFPVPEETSNFWTLKHWFIADSLEAEKNNNFTIIQLSFVLTVKLFHCTVSLWVWDLNTCSFRQDKRLGWLLKMGQLDCCRAMVHAKRCQPSQEHSRFLKADNERFKGLLSVAEVHYNILDSWRDWCVICSDRMQKNARKVWNPTFNSECSTQVT